MTDKELLELAAKAHGGLVYIKDMNSWIFEDDDGNRGAWWNPLTDDGDALRLAVKLNLSMDLFEDNIFVGYTPNCNDCEQLQEESDSDPYAATRRAIVRAAAEIGREMK